MTTAFPGASTRRADFLGTAAVLAVAWATMALLALVAIVLVQPLVRPGPHPDVHAAVIGLDLESMSMRPSGTAGRSLMLMHPAVDLRFAPGEPTSFPRVALPRPIAPGGND